MKKKVTILAPKNFMICEGLLSSEGFKAVDENFLPAAYYGCYDFNTKEEEETAKKNLELFKKSKMAEPLRKVGFEDKCMLINTHITLPETLSLEIMNIFNIAANIENDEKFALQVINDGKELFINIDERRISIREGGQTLSLNLENINGERYISSAKYNPTTYKKGSSYISAYVADDNDIHPALKYLIDNLPAMNNPKCKKNFDYFKVFEEELRNNTPTNDGKPVYEVSSFFQKKESIDNSSDYGKFKIKCNAASGKNETISVILKDGIMEGYNTIKRGLLNKTERENMNQIIKIAMEYDYREVLEEKKQDKEKKKDLPPQEETIDR